MDEYHSKLGEDAIKFKSVYLNSLIQFIKWTTTFAFAAIIWTASSFKIIGIPSNWFQILSLIFLIFSVVITIIIMYSVVFSAGSDWAHQSDLFISSVYRTHVKEIRTNEDYDKVYPTAKKYHLTCINPIIPQTPTQFNVAILLHLILLLIGVLFYVLALFPS
jgi:hypothetical protein